MQSGVVLFKSVGVLEYTENSLRVLVDPELSRYYRSLIPKYIRTNPQMYAPHVTVVRSGKEVPPDMSAWKRHQGREVEFEYSNVVRFGTVYCWLDVFSQQLEEVRRELGLPVHSPFTLPPDGYGHCFHATLGNFKELHQK